jgi:biotin-dependent carboxylase-like uncharacterized protein
VTPSLRVIAPGLSTTVQDAGRVGWQRFGIPVSGALDRVALAAANIVAGNAAGAAALECLYQGPTLEVEAGSARIAVAGFGATLEVADGNGEFVRRMAALESVTVKRGARAKVVIQGPGVSAYLAVEGGIAVPELLGSRSTCARARLGGFEGRALISGDAVPLAALTAAARDERRLPDLELGPVDRLRVVLGPQDDHFTAKAIRALLNDTFKIAPISDRMGLRLTGPRLEHAKGFDIVSDGTVAGAIQVPGDGQPIILLADRQTTGGYPKIATVISADLPALGRAGPGAELRFRAVSVAEAEAARRALDAMIALWPQRLEAVRGAIDAQRLLDQNLISGVTDAES